MSDIPHPIHASDDDLVRYIQGRLDPERVSAMDPHLLDCGMCRERLSRSIGSQLMLHLVGRSKTEDKRERSEPRFCTGSEAILQNLSPLSLDRQGVKIVDISKNGLGILAPKAALPGTIVQVRINTAVELGEVRHCSARDDSGYRIGLRFVAVPDEKPEGFAARQGSAAGGLEIPAEEQPDRRETPCRPPSESAAVTVLGTGQVLQGEVRSVRGDSSQILLSKPIPITAQVKIEYAGKILVGEVVYCREEQSGWLLGMRVGTSLPGVTDLTNAMRRSG